jgi:hypothetical protein
MARTLNAASISVVRTSTGSVSPFNDNSGLVDDCDNHDACGRDLVLDDCDRGDGDGCVGDYDGPN